MAFYPDDIASFREKLNLPNQPFDVNKKTTVYVEDFSAVEDEVIAVETTLGENPQSTYDTVADFLLALAAGAGTLEDVKVAEFSITNDQLTNLVTAPVLLIPAPGAGKVLIVFFAIGYMNFPGDPYVSPNEDNYLGVMGGTDTANEDVQRLNLDELEYLPLYSAEQWSILSVWEGRTTLLGIENLGVYLLDAGTADMTGGDPADVYRLRIYYDIFTNIV